MALILAGLESVGSMLLLLVLALGLARFTTQPWRFVLIGVLAAGWWLSGAFASREMLPVLARSTSIIITLTLVYLLIRRQQTGIAITMLGMVAALSQLSLIAAAYPLAWLHALLSTLVCILPVMFLLKHWHKHSTDAVVMTGA